MSNETQSFTHIHITAVYAFLHSSQFKLERLRFTRAQGAVKGKRQWYSLERQASLGTGNEREKSRGMHGAPVTVG